MWVLGIYGSLAADTDPVVVPPNVFHDSAAALLRDGALTVAIEEERLCRVKHANRFPARAIAHCLASQGLTLEAVDRIAFAASPAYLERYLRQRHGEMPGTGDDPREAVAAALERACGIPVEPSRIVFVEHHRAHAASAWALCGRPRALVISADGGGDFHAGLAAVVDGGRVRELRRYDMDQSLGQLYLAMVRHLGFDLFDEYKVMGLAPYGDPAAYREVFQRLYTLAPAGRYTLHTGRYDEAGAQLPPRRPGEPLTRAHQDFAAALQEALETLALHLVGHFRARTGERVLCAAGGVFLNCTLNGKLLASGWFEEVFVPPAANDAGCALGAALAAHAEMVPSPLPPPPLAHAFWGTETADSPALERELRRWRGALRFERLDDPPARAARLLAGGAVIGWVQGRSELGPRALGNRSILAHPGPAANRDRINAMVKKREAFRPFAPSVLEEALGRVFAVPAGVRRLPYMLFTVPVRPAYRRRLAAITHVDGSARAQTVRRRDHPRYWALLRAFEALTGLPVVLNTSFNNHREPIVDSARDAIVCYLTTGLDHLVIGDFLVTRTIPEGTVDPSWIPSLPAHRALRAAADGHPPRLADRHCPKRDLALSPPLFALLAGVDGERPLGALLAPFAAAEAATLRTAVADLWQERHLILTPADT